MATKVKKTSKKPVKAIKSKAKKTIKKAKKPVKLAKTKKVVKKASPTKSKTNAKKIIKKAISKPAHKKLAKAKAISKKSVVATSKKNRRVSAKPKTTKVTSAPVSTFLISGEIVPYHERPGEQYMNEKQREHFRKILLHRKQQIMMEMDRTVHHLQDEPVNLPDPNDRASQEEEFSLELRARDRERKFIKNIEEALQRLDDGIYGECESCGVEIGIRRLEARPTATLCIDCKTLDEIREKQMGG